jgi:FMN phosphatase YigB (HAD superfamily)
LEERLGLVPGRADELVFNGPTGLQAQRGEITATQLWASAQEALGLDDAGLLAFRDAFFAGDRLDAVLVAWIKQLRPRYQTAIISNAMDDLLEIITRRYPLADAFDLVVGSAYEGVMKPDPIIYRRTLAQLGCAPNEAVFIDDAPHNIAGAQAVGMATIHYTPGLDLPAALAQLGILSNAP